MLLNALEMLWVRSDENLVLRTLLVLPCICRDSYSVSNMWWRKILSPSMADLPVMAMNWVSFKAPVLMAATSVRQAARYSSIVPGIESRDIRHRNLRDVRSRFGLGITIQVVCLQLFGK